MFTWKALKIDQLSQNIGKARKLICHSKETQLGQNPNVLHGCIDNGDHMKALLLANASEAKKLETATQALQSEGHITITLDLFTFTPPFDEQCNQSKEIKDKLAAIDAIVYFASHENENNRCLDEALTEAARMDKKVICVWLDEEAKLNPNFEGLGDSLISKIEDLPSALSGGNSTWENSDGSLKQDRPFKRYKCGNKK